MVRGGQRARKKKKKKMARVYTYIRGKVTLLWYKLRYSAIRGEDGDEEEG